MHGANCDRIFMGEAVSRLGGTLCRLGHLVSSLPRPCYISNKVVRKNKTETAQRLDVCVLIA